MKPVGSKALMELLDHPLSSVTIRNEMAVLERAGLLEKTHISSGRIPSRRGYRYYVHHRHVLQSLTGCIRSQDNAGQAGHFRQDITGDPDDFLQGILRYPAAATCWPSRSSPT